MIEVEVYYNGGNSNDFYTREDYYNDVANTSYEEGAANFVFNLMKEDTANFELSHRFEIVVSGVEYAGEYRDAYRFAALLMDKLAYTFYAFETNNIVIRFEV